MMKIGSFIRPGYFVALIGISIPVSAMPLLENSAYFHQLSGSEKSVDVEGSETGPTDEELKKKCAMARKNIGILKSSGGIKTFTTSENEIVMYTPAEIKQMIKDNESVIKDECGE